MKKLFLIIFAIGMFGVSASEDKRPEERKKVTEKSRTHEVIKQEQQDESNKFDPELDAIDDDLTRDEGIKDYK